MDKKKLMLSKTALVKPKETASTAKKKKLGAKNTVQPNPAPKARAKNLISPEAREASEQLEWRKEKREYWSSRFRKALAEIALKPKKKVANAL
jgi:hypothetical protein